MDRTPLQSISAMLAPTTPCTVAQIWRTGRLKRPSRSHAIQQSGWYSPPESKIAGVMRLRSAVRHDDAQSSITHVDGARCNDSSPCRVRRGDIVRDDLGNGRLFKGAARCGARRARSAHRSVDIDTPDYPLVPVNLAEQFRVGFTPADAVVPDARLSEPLVRRMRGYRRPPDGKKLIMIDLNRLFGAQDSPRDHPNAVIGNSLAAEHRTTWPVRHGLFAGS
jgi:hypothetical protein